MITIECQTLFDITATGVTGHFKQSRVPFIDDAGTQVLDEGSWIRSRNQQRNWETLTQIISLRTQIDNVKIPTKRDNVWVFEFTVSTPDAFGDINDPTAILRYDANGVPMINNLNNEFYLDPYLVIDGPEQNIWFSIKQ